MGCTNNNLDFFLKNNTITNQNYQKVYVAMDAPKLFEAGEH
jgi:hypothetical protein